MNRRLLYSAATLADAARFAAMLCNTPAYARLCLLQDVSGCWCVVLR